MKRKQSEIEFSCGHDDCNRLRRPRRPRRHHHHNVAVVAFFFSSSSSFYIFVLFQLDSYVRTHSVPVCKCYMMYEIYIYIPIENDCLGQITRSRCAVYLFLYTFRRYSLGRSNLEILSIVFLLFFGLLCFYGFFSAFNFHWLCLFFFLTSLLLFLFLFSLFFCTSCFCTSLFIIATSPLLALFQSAIKLWP